MSPFKQSLGNAKLVIVSLLLGLMVSFVVNLFLGYLLYSVPKNMTVFVPPHIAATGFTTKTNQISDAEVYRFAYSTWTSVMTWTTNGAKALPHNLAVNSPYLTVPFQNTLKMQAAQMNNQGFLFQHTQVSFGVNGSSFDPKDVKYIGNGTWLVHLDIRTINYVADPHANSGFGAAHVASDAETSFIFKVVRYPMIQGQNLSGLALSGFAIPPAVVKVYQ